MIARVRVIRLLVAVFLIMGFSSGVSAQVRAIHMFAHRGGWSVNANREYIIPENSLEGIAQAAVMGYEGVECDVKYTKDKKMVLMHDKTINRTMRNACDYSELREKVMVEGLTFDQLRNDYVLASVNPSFRTCVPTLEEFLLECKKYNMVPMLHSRIEESYELAQKILGDGWICFTGNFDKILKVREYSNCMVLYSPDKGTLKEMLETGSFADGIIRYLKQIGGDCGVSSMKYDLYTPEFIDAVKNAGFHVQASIFPAVQESAAIKNKVTYLLTDRVRPTK